MPLISADVNSNEKTAETGAKSQADSPNEQNDPRIPFFNHRPPQSHHFSSFNAHPPLNGRPNPHQLHTTNLWQLLHMQHRPTSLANIVAQYSHLVSQHHLATLNQHRNPYFYYHSHTRPGQGSSQHQQSTPKTPASPAARSSPQTRPTPSPPPTPAKRSPIPPVERPRSLKKYKRQYKKWWNQFHADLTSCGTQNGFNDGVTSVFRVIGGRISSIKSWPWMVSCTFHR